MRFSIIMPVYNVEKYIAKCMDSVVGQSYDDFEVIVVDDESPDNSIKIVEQYADAYPGNIHIIHQKNTRQGGARNNGVKHAKGEYILFLDSDDYVHPDMLKIVDRHLQETPCDILVFRYAEVTEAGKTLHVSDFNGLEPGLYHPREDKNILKLPFGPVNKAYRREFYVDSNVLFPEKVLYEDAIVRLLYAKADSISICDECLYYYVQSANSTMRQRITDRMLDIITVTDQVLAAFQADGLYDAFREELDSSLIRGVLSIVNIIVQNDPKNPLLTRLADYTVKTFPDYAVNPTLEPWVKESVDLIASQRIAAYKLRILLIPAMKRSLLKCPVIEKLYQFKKNRAR